MATTAEFLRDYGVKIRANGQKRWPDDVFCFAPLVLSQESHPPSVRAFKELRAVRSATLGIRRDCRGASDNPAGQCHGCCADCQDRAGNRNTAMMIPSNRVRVLVSTQPIDFRRGRDGLAALVSPVLRKDPFTHCQQGNGTFTERGTFFVFRSQRADRLKLLCWGGIGLAPLGDARIACRAMDGLQTAGRCDLYLARDQGWGDYVEPCPVRGAVCGTRLA